MADAFVLGSALYEIKTTLGQFGTDLDKAKKLADDKSAGIGASFSQIGKAFLGVGTVIAGALVAVTVSAINTADELNKLSQKTGVSVEALSALKYGAELSDVSLEGLAKGLTFLNKNMVELRGGSKSAREGFDLLGEGTAQLVANSANAEEALGIIADRFATMKDGPEKAAAAVKIFGKAGVDLIPLLNQGSAGIAAFTSEAHKMGQIVSTEAAAAAEEFNDNVSKIGKFLGGLGITIANAVLPKIVVLSGALVDAAKDSGILSTAASAVDIVLKNLSATGAIIGGIFSAMGVVIRQVGAAVLLVARGEFKGASDAIKVGVKDIGTTAKETAANVQAAFADSTKAVVEHKDKATKPLREEVTLLTEEQKKQVEEQKKLTEEFNSSIRPADELAKKIDVLRKAHKSDQEILAGYGDAIRDAVAKHLELGQAIPKVVAELDKERIAADAAKREQKLFVDILDSVSDGSLNTAISVGKFRAELDRISKEREWLVTVQSAKQVFVELGDDVLKVTDAYDKQQAGAKKLAAESDTLADVIGNQVSTALTDTAGALTDLLFDFDGFGKTVIGIVENLGKSITRILIEGALSKLAKSFAGLLGGGGTAFAGTGGGAGGGPLGLGGLFGGATGLGLGAITGGLFGGITAGRAIGGTAGGAIGGAIAGAGTAFGLGALGIIGAGATGGISAGMAGLAALGGPVGAAIVAAAVGIGIIISKIGGGRKQADQIVPSQNELTANFGKVLDALNEGREAGTLTPELLDQATAKIRELATTFFQFAGQFSKAGPQAIRDMTRLMEQVIHSIDEMRPEAARNVLAGVEGALETISTGALSTFRDALEKVNADLAEAEQSLEDQQHALEDFDRTVEAAAKNLEDAGFWQGRYNELIADAAREAAAAQEKVLSTQERIKLLQEQVEEDRLRRIIATSKDENAIAAAKGALDKIAEDRAERERQAREAELQALQDSLPGLIAAAEEAKAKAEEAAKAAEEQIAKEKEQVKAFLDGAQAQRDALIEQMALTKAHVSELHSEQDELKRAIDLLDDSTEARKSELEALREFITATLANIEELRRRAAELRASIPGTPSLTGDGTTPSDPLPDGESLVASGVAFGAAQSTPFTPSQGAAPAAPTSIVVQFTINDAFDPQGTRTVIEEVVMPEIERLLSSNAGGVGDRLLANVGA
jgi:hypothetical protein